MDTQRIEGLETTPLPVIAGAQEMVEAERSACQVADSGGNPYARRIGFGRAARELVRIAPEFYPGQAADGTAGEDTPQPGDVGRQNE